MDLHAMQTFASTGVASPPGQLPDDTLIRVFDQMLQQSTDRLLIFVTGIALILGIVFTLSMMRRNKRREDINGQMLAVITQVSAQNAEQQRMAERSDERYRAVIEGQGELIKQGNVGLTALVKLVEGQTTQIKALDARTGYQNTVIERSNAVNTEILAFLKADRVDEDEKRAQTLAQAMQQAGTLMDGKLTPLDSRLSHLEQTVTDGNAALDKKLEEALRLLRALHPAPPTNEGRPDPPPPIEVHATVTMEHDAKDEPPAASEAAPDTPPEALTPPTTP